MRVAALTLDYPPRRFIGSELATHAMLRHLVQRGHEVDVWVTAVDALDDWEHEGVRVHWDRRYRTVDCDVFVTHADINARWLRRIEAPLVGITHNAREQMRKSLASVDWALVVHNSHATARALDGLTAAPALVVHPPVDWRDYRVDRTGAEAITLVNVTGEKGSDTFYEMARRLPDHRFLGVLGGWGEPEAKPLPNVELLPHCADMRSVYARTRVLLMPSEHESWGRVAVEAMSSGIPVVATDLPGVREMLGDAGYLVESYWFDRYEEILRDLDDPDTYSKASAAATVRALELDPAPQLDLFADALECLTVPQRWMVGMEA